MPAEGQPTNPDMITSVPGMEPAEPRPDAIQAGQRVPVELPADVLAQKRAEVESNIAMQNAAVDSIKRADEARQAQAQAQAERPLAPGAITEVPDFTKK